MATPTAATPATAATGSTPSKMKFILIGGSVLLIVISLFSLLFSGCDDGGPSWTKDPRFIHNTQQEAWEMK